jgi:hypothetical protein
MRDVGVDEMARLQYRSACAQEQAQLKQGPLSSNAERQLCSTSPCIYLSLGLCVLCVVCVHIYCVMEFIRCVCVCVCACVLGAGMQSGPLLCAAKSDVPVFDSFVCVHGWGAQFPREFCGHVKFNPSSGRKKICKNATDASSLVAKRCRISRVSCSASPPALSPPPPPPPPRCH